MGDVIVQHRHGRALRYCNRGMRAWCQKQGISWSDFLRNGFPAQVFEATNDPQAMKMVELARNEIEGGN